MTGLSDEQRLKRSVEHQAEKRKKELERAAAMLRAIIGATRVVTAGDKKKKGRAS